MGERICKVVVVKKDGKIEPCGGKIVFFKEVAESKRRNRGIPIYICEKCGLIYGPNSL